MSLKQSFQPSFTRSSLVMFLTAAINLTNFSMVKAGNVFEINRTTQTWLSFSTQSDQTKASKTINSALLIGEWSQAGKCNYERFIYTSNGKYIWRKKEGRRWKNQYQGIYVFKNGILIVADGPNTGGAQINIYSLTRKSFIGTWVATEELTFENPEDAKINYTKCTTSVNIFVNQENA
ncbi:hypothetical protein [Nostoc sp.]|uniref:hypothetical protein n=1 Tax=Nostoc sp. TaxID=1180 RepID=UPI002FFB41CF